MFDHAEAEFKALEEKKNIVEVSADVAPLNVLTILNMQHVWPLELRGCREDEFHELAFHSSSSLPLKLVATAQSRVAVCHPFESMSNYARWSLERSLRKDLNRKVPI